MLHVWPTCWSLPGLMLLTVCADLLFDLVPLVCSSAFLSPAVASWEVSQSRVSQHWFGLQMASPSLCLVSSRLRLYPLPLLFPLVLVVATRLYASRCSLVFARYHLSSRALIRTLSGSLPGRISRDVLSTHCQRPVSCV